jgi:hypothetical protein
VTSVGRAGGDFSRPSLAFILQGRRGMKVNKIILEGWESYKNKVANSLLTPENEKMMQLQLAQIYQALGPVYEYEASESIKVLLEVPVTIRGNIFRSIDIVIAHTRGNDISHYPIELKCFRLLTRSGDGRRGAQNLGMYDYWEDFENIENYSKLPGYAQAFQFTLTDDPYYVNTEHKGAQVAVYSTCIKRIGITGKLHQPIANRKGEIDLVGTYSMAGWQKKETFYFIAQQT